MVWRIIQRLLLDEKVIERLAESYPVRRAAQWVVYMINRSKAKGIIENKTLPGPKDFLTRKAFDKLSGKLETKLKSIKDDLERKSKL